MNRERKINDLYESLKSITEPDAFRRVIEGEPDINVLADLRDRFWDNQGEKPWTVKEINREITDRNRSHRAESSTSSVQNSTPLTADKLTLHEIFTQLTIGQFWKFLSIVFGLFVAAIGVGWTVRGTVEEVKVLASTAKAEDLERRLASTEEQRALETDKLRQISESHEKERSAETEKLRQLQDKDLFLSLYLRYVMARDKLDPSISYEVARQALDDYIEGRVERDRLLIHKGDGQLATVEFPDGTVWTLPKELHMVESK